MPAENAPSAARTSVDDIAEAEANLASAAQAGPGLGGASAALVGLGYALLAVVRQQREFYREVVDLLDQARGD